MTNLTVVPDVEEEVHPEFEELMAIAVRIVESMISKIDFGNVAAEVAEHLVTDPEDAKVIARLAKQVTVAVYFDDESEDGDAEA